jgi:hypothetical protein
MFVEVLAGLLLAGAIPCAVDEIAPIKRQLAIAKTRQPLDSLKMATSLRFEIDDIWPVFAKTSVSDKANLWNLFLLKNTVGRL